MEPHVFCGPEFVLAIPEDRLADILTHSGDDAAGDTTPSTETTTPSTETTTPSASPVAFHGPLREAVLHTFQTDIFNVLTPHLRRRLHHGYAHTAPTPSATATETFDRLDRQQRQRRMTSSSLTVPRHQGAVPPPPSSLRFLEPTVRYPTTFKSRLTKTDAKDGAENSPAAVVDTDEVGATSPPTPPSQSLASAASQSPALRAASTEEEELLFNTVRVLTSQRALTSSSGGPQSATAALSAALAAAATPSSSSSSGDAPARPAVTFFLLYVCDARVAAELYMLCLANFHISLSYDAKLYAVFARTAKAAPIILEEVLAKRELLRSHANMDGDLHEVLSSRLTDAFVDSVLQARADKNRMGGGAGLMTSEERHNQHIEAILQYCEDKVQYAGVLDNDGEASPFLLAMGLVLKLELTPEDLLVHFLLHPRRIVRAVALFLARYLFPPEDLAPFFAPSVEDAVVIACTEDQSLTTSLQALSRQLLEKDEVNEAWLPGAAPWRRYWLPRVVAPMITDMQRYVVDQTQERERRLAATDSHTASTATMKSANGTHSQAASSAHTSGPDAYGSLAGTGRGVGTLGFRKLTDLVQFAREKERNAVQETLRQRLGQYRLVDGVGASRKRRRPDDGAADGDDWELIMQERDDDDDLLIHVEVEGGDDDDNGWEGGLRAQYARPTAVAPNGLAGGGEASSISSHLGRDGGSGAHRDQGPASPAQRQKERLTARQTAMKEGYSLILSLLGRAQPFQRDEHYLQF